MCPCSDASEREGGSIERRNFSSWGSPAREQEFKNATEWFAARNQRKWGDEDICLLNVKILSPQPDFWENLTSESTYLTTGQDLLSENGRSVLTGKYWTDVSQVLKKADTHSKKTTSRNLRGEVDLGAVSTARATQVLSDGSNFQDVRFNPGVIFDR